MKRHILKNYTTKESQLQRYYKYNIYPTDSTIKTDKGFVNIDNGSMGGTHWVCFLIKDSKSFYHDSFGGRPDEFFLNQLPKPILYHNQKIEDISS